MASPLRAARQAHGWSQADLATRAGLSRPEISAIETGRVTPGVDAAIALGRALGRTVEELFSTGSEPAAWASPPVRLPTRVRVADIGKRRLAYPCEASAFGIEPHDALVTTEALELTGPPPEPTLVVAGCDPAVGLLRERMRARGVRVLALTRSSGTALELLAAGRVHVAGVHLARGRRGGGNVRAVHARLGSGYRLRRWASWEQGVAFGPDIEPRRLDDRRLARLSWIGRDAGSGARLCLEELLRGQRPPRYAALARDHRDVVRALELGVGQAGICVRVAAEEAGVPFLPVRSEPYDLCYAAASEREPVIAELLAELRAPALKQMLADIAGYDATHTGELAEAS